MNLFWDVDGCCNLPLSPFEGISRPFRVERPRIFMQHWGPVRVTAAVKWTQVGGARPVGMPSGGAVTLVGLDYSWAKALDNGTDPPRDGVTRFVVERQLAWLRARPA